MAVDGLPGPEKAIRDFQRAQGIKLNGLVGPQT
ncbi:peptidoglycan-binding protein [Halalkalibacter sp. APA_J-10(15)]